MEIRDFTVTEKEDYLRMARDFYSGDASLFDISLKNFEDTFSMAMEGSPYLRLLAVCHDGAIAGYILLALYWSCEGGGMCVSIEEIYIKDQFRGLGLGGKAIECLLKQYEGKAKRFRLEVCPKNLRVKKLYEKCGFEVLDYIQMIRQE